MSCRRRASEPADHGAITEPHPDTHDDASKNTQSLSDLWSAMPSDLVLKTMNFVHRATLTLSFGKLGWHAGGMPVLELTTTGRKTGEARTSMLTSPLRLGYAYVVVASRGGDDRHPAWFLNLQANPAVEVSVAGAPRVPMTARVATPEEREEMWPEIAAKYKNYADYQKRTTVRSARAPRNRLKEADMPMSHVVDPELAEYIAAHSSAPDHVQQQLMSITEERTGGYSRMQIGGDQGTLFEMFARASARATPSRSARSPATRRSASPAASAPEGHADLLRRERGVDRHRAGALGARRRGRPDRPAHRAGLETLAALPADDALRPRLHRRRQAELPPLLRGAPPPHAPDRA